MNSGERWDILSMRGTLGMNLDSSFSSRAKMNFYEKKMFFFMC